MALPAYVTVTDAAGRVLFRRAATQAEIEEAMQVADSADAEAQAVLKRIAEEREQALAAAAAPEPLPSAQPEPQPVQARKEAEPEPQREEPESEEPAIQGMGDEDFDFLNAAIGPLGEADEK